MPSVSADEDLDDAIKGATDGTLIGNVGDALKVSASLDVSPSDNPGCPTISSKYRIDFSETDITIPTAFVTLFSYTGSGKLFGFIFVNDHKEVETKLTIDSTEVIFSLTSVDIGVVQLQGPQLTALVPESGGIMTTNNDKTVSLKLTCPIVFTTEVKIEAKRTNSTDRTMLRSIVALTKEA